MIKYILVFLLGGIITYFIMTDYPKVDPNAAVNDSLTSIINKKDYELDSIKCVLDSISKEDKIKDTIIILKKYERAKDGVSIVCNDSLNKIIFLGTGHL